MLIHAHVVEYRYGKDLRCYVSTFYSGKGSLDPLVNHNMQMRPRGKHPGPSC